MASSRFFAGSDSETESSSSEEELIQKPTVFQRPAYFDSDSDDDVKRVVKSEKDKRFDEMQELIKKIRNSRRTDDIVAVHQNFDALGKVFEKSKKVVQKEGVPHFYIKHLCDLDDYSNLIWEDREKRKNMNKNQTKAFTVVRRELRRYMDEFEEQIAQYREDPDKYIADEEEEEEEKEDEEDAEESDDEEPPEVVAKEKKPKVVKNFDDMDSDDTWTSSSEESSSSDEDYQDNPAARFLKKDPAEEKIKRKMPKERETKHREKVIVDKDDAVQSSARSTADRPKLFEKEEDVTLPAVFKKLEEISDQQGKSGMGRRTRLRILYELMGLAEKHEMGPAVTIKALLIVVETFYDYNDSECMSSSSWDRFLINCEQLTEALTNNSQIIVNSSVVEQVLDGDKVQMKGNLYAAMERMDEEFFKLLLDCEAHSTRYVRMLKAEERVCNILEELAKYAECHSSIQDMCCIKLLQIKHIYYKFDKETADGESDSSISRMSQLCRFIYTNDTTDKIRTQAILFNIYHLALHNKWFEARDLMLMSHLQDSSSQADIPTQICYNRAMVQLGLCAFRQGHIKDAHNCLVDIQSSLRVRELLAQGMIKKGQTERPVAEVKTERRRQTPYHMHINLDLLECTYLVSAMLIEIPYLAAHELDARRGRMSKNFHHVLKNSERAPLVGPPESMREHVVQACKAMKRGEWKACRDYLINDKMNVKVWNRFPNSEEVTEMIALKIQEQAVRTYLFSFSSIYDSLSMKILSDMFDLSLASVHSIVSKMIINEELMAALDEPTETVIMRRSEPSRLQSLALQLGERVSQLVENNERLMEAKQIIYQGKGGFDRKDNRNNQQGGFRRHQNREGGGGGGGGGWDRRPNYHSKNY